MVKALFNVILNLVQSLIGIILVPINTLIEPLFPQSISTAITNFTNFLNTYIIRRTS